MTQTFTDQTGNVRCSWSETAPQFIDYHDNEWGFPSNNDYHLFEKLCLESFQSGLSWRTILVKRENFRRVFKQFNFHEIALFTELDVAHLLQDKGIVRNRRKIEAVINNAQRACELIKSEGSLAQYLWRFQPATILSIEPQSATTSVESVALSKDLKKRGWKFLGPTTLYAFMQSMGFFNDHVVGCMTREKAAKAYSEFAHPNKN
ncbi:MAG: DNA-3-methyladenine glycosylase I [Oceanospirillaceae bacterium]|jgi:DNA-3-methyladenine glycosylase I